jgi:DNA-binding LacI/PurR family transcriptional regulator
MTDTVKTIADIAKIAGVSKSTVSRALNDSPLLNQETKERIQAIAKEHHFSFHQGARSLSLQRSNTIGLILPVYPEDDFGTGSYFVTDPFFVELLRGIMIKVAAYGYDLLIGQPAEHSPGDVQRYLESKRADGLILLGCQGYFEAIYDMFGSNAPIIVWGAAEDLIYCSVNSDNSAGGRLAVQHLREIGRKRIAFLGGYEGEPEVLLRYQGYVQGLQKGNRALDPALVKYGDYTSQSGYDSMKAILANTPDVDGVFACSDLMAIGAMEAIRESGRQVAADVSVVGFDDVPLAAYCSPPLTTIRQPLAKAGETLVQNLVQYLQDKIITRAILPVELVVRKSSLPQ